MLMRLHAATRLAYYGRKDPCPADNATRISTLIKDKLGVRLKVAQGNIELIALCSMQYPDLVIDDELVVRFEVVTEPPDIPHPRDLLYLNACLFAFNKPEGILLYLYWRRESAEFSITKNNRMFQEIIRRVSHTKHIIERKQSPYCRTM